MFKNNSKMSLVIREEEIVGWTMLIRTNKVDKAWKKEVEWSTLTHILHQGLGAALNYITVKDMDKLNTYTPLIPEGGAVGSADQARGE